MTLLLLLSALLSALTGAGSAARTPQLAVAVARSAEVQAAAVAGEVAVAPRPANGPAGLAVVAALARTASVPALAPLGYGERRRE